MKLKFVIVIWIVIRLRQFEDAIDDVQHACVVGIGIEIDTQYKPQLSWRIEVTFVCTAFHPRAGAGKFFGDGELKIAKRPGV